MRRGTWALALLVLVVALAVTLTVLPASWLAAGVNHGLLQGDRISLIDAQGTVWQGDTLVALSDGRQALTLPGRVAWRLRPAGLLRGVVQANISHPSMADAVEVRWAGSWSGASSWQVDAGRAQIAAATLNVAGAPFNTIRPEGVLELAWDTLAGDQGPGGATLRGRASLVWRDAVSALTPIRPIGSYQLLVIGEGERARIGLTTLKGPLSLVGQGSWSAASGFSFSGEASATPETQQQLNGLLSLLGQRAGDRALLKF